MDQQLVIRNATQKEMHLFIKWGINENWNQSYYDAEYFYKADPNGFFVGEVDGKIVTIISAVGYSNNTGFISFYITKPEFRGKGYGKKIFQHAMNYLQGKNIGMDGAVEVANIYEKWGFKKYFKTLAYAGTINEPYVKDDRLMELKQIDFNIVLSYDLSVSPFHRQEFLKQYIDIPQGYAVGFYEDNRLKGYGVLKKAYQVYRICPLYADTLEIATKIMSKLLSYIDKTQQIVINVHDCNKESIQMCEKYGMKITYDSYRMYNGSMPQIQYQRIFAILSSDIG